MNNLARARAADAVKVVRAAVTANATDATLQYRGVNLLERLAPDSTLTMPKAAMIRSASMRAEEMVLGVRLSARSFVRSESSRASGTASDARSARSGGGDGESAAAVSSHAAIMEVDEDAVLVDDGEGDPAAGGGGGGGGEAKPPPGALPAAVAS